MRGAIQLVHRVEAYQNQETEVVKRTVGRCVQYGVEVVGRKKTGRGIRG